MSLEDTVVEHTTQLSQLHAVVSALNFPTVLNSQSRGAVALRTSDGQNVGNILLALCVVGGHLEQCLSQNSGVKSVNTGVNFGNFEFFGGSVLRLNNGGHFASLVTDNTTVGAGLTNVGGQDSYGVLVFFVEGNQFAQGFGAQQRNIAVGHQDGAGDGCLRIQGIQTDLNRATSTRSLVLINDGYLRVKCKHMLSDLIALVAYHNSEALGVQISCSSDSMLNHGSTTNAVHDLGGSGLHARTSACSENDHCRGCQFSVHWEDSLDEVARVRSERGPITLYQRCR